jgi:hypothetical protein
MAVGTGSTFSSTLPSVPYVIDPSEFQDSTERQVATIADQQGWQPGASEFAIQLPKQGVLSHLRLIFSGTLTVAAAASGDTQPTTGPTWPYGLLHSFTLKSGGQNNLWSVDGCDLRAMHHARWPGHRGELVDEWPGSEGGGDELPAGTYPISLTWDVPVAWDQVTLAAGVFLGSSSANVRASADPVGASMRGLIASGGTSSLWTWSGCALQVEETYFEVPVSSKGELILPDISRVHIAASIEESLVAGGTQQLRLIRTDGLLERVFASIRNGDAGGNPGAAVTFAPVSSAGVSEVALRWGVKSKPYVYDPAAALVSLNAALYGSPLPYDRVCFDMARINPKRDAIAMGGVTELMVEAQITEAITSGAQFRCMEEILV